jgi:hypothetical protein
MKKTASSKTNLITPEVISLLKTKTEQCLNFYASMRLRKTKKQISEDISGLLESILEDAYVNVEAPKKDSEPDIIFNKKTSIEIKTTCTESWRGGAFSKRGGYFVLINWKIVNKSIIFFIAGMDLKETDWKLNKNKNYYATTVDKKMIMSRNIDKYSGDIFEHYRKSQRCIKIIQQ